ncbi:MAG TPA: very short patch repair endonuclease [Geminicoccaceae bacterium]|nr:very short patch repair endonuclease [Geminicoccaceae bacterium]
MDRLSKEQRSALMARIRGRDTMPERYVRSRLFAAGFRFRLHRRDLPGSPDIVLPGRRVAVFVHGCFWHDHGCRRGRRPGTNPAFWEAKFERNDERDRRNAALLAELGWRVAVVWTCDLEGGVAEVLGQLRGTPPGGPTAPAPAPRP